MEAENSMIITWYYENENSLDVGTPGFNIVFFLYTAGMSTEVDKPILVKPQWYNDKVSWHFCRYNGLKFAFWLIATVRKYFIRTKNLQYMYISGTFVHWYVCPWYINYQRLEGPLERTYFQQHLKLSIEKLLLSYENLVSGCTKHTSDQKVRKSSFTQY